jgi:hypothetical protein
LTQNSIEQNKKSTNPTTEQVLDFLEDVDNHLVADRTRDEAFFILEAALNYAYKRPVEYKQLAGSATENLTLQFSDADKVIGESLGLEYQRLITWAEYYREEGQVVEFIDISNARDADGVGQLSATVVYATLAAASYYQNIGNWKAGANYGDCVNAIFGIGDAATKTAEVYNFRYANNWLNSAVYQNEDVYFTNIKIAGTGGSSGYNYPAVTPDLYLPSDPGGSTGSLTNIGQFALLGSPLDNLYTYPGINDCVQEADINTYATRLANNIYSVNPSNQGEPFKVLMASDWLFVPGNANTHHNIYAAYFGVPNS